MAKLKLSKVQRLALLEGAVREANGEHWFPKGRPGVFKALHGKGLVELRHGEAWHLTEAGRDEVRKMWPTSLNNAVGGLGVRREPPRIGPSIILKRKEEDLERRLLEEFGRDHRLVIMARGQTIYDA